MKQSYSRLRVLIAGQHNRFDHVLATNIRCWGYDVIILPWTVTMDSYSEIEGDVLLYDLDESSRMMSSKDSHILSMLLASEHTCGMIKNCVEQWPRIRLSIALSSCSVSRATLEHIGAITCLQKPFEIGRLQHYLRVLQRLLLEPTQPLQACVQRRILVVDDDATIANAIRNYLLFEYEYDVKVAYDGLEALELYLDWRPHCIVTDLIMPRMNGYQVIQCLAASMQQHMPAFVITSALTQFEEPTNLPYLQGKMLTYINKPFNMPHLLSVIEQACMESV